MDLQKSILLKRHYGGDAQIADNRRKDDFVDKFFSGALEARELMGMYCEVLYEKYGTYEEVARRIKLDPRTVKKNVQRG